MKAVTTNQSLSWAYTAVGRKNHTAINNLYINASAGITACNVIFMFSMNKLLSTLTAIGFVATSTYAVAQNKPDNLMQPAGTSDSESLPPVILQQPTDVSASDASVNIPRHATIQKPAAPAASDNTAIQAATDKSAAETAVPDPRPHPITHAELKDGTRVEFGDNGSVTLSNPDGTKTPAPDGTYTLRNSTTFDIKDGIKQE